MLCKDIAQLVCECRYTRAHVHLLGRLLKVPRGMSADSAMTVNLFVFSFSDLKTSIDAPLRALTLHTVSGKMLQVLTVYPRLLHVGLSNCQWHNQVWEQSANPEAVTVPEERLADFLAVNKPAMKLPNFCMPRRCFSVEACSSVQSSVMHTFAHAACQLRAMR